MSENEELMDDLFGGADNSMEDVEDKLVAVQQPFA